MRIRLAAAALALAAVSSTASAQGAAASNPLSFGVSAGVALPMGDFGNVANLGFGGAGHVFYGLSEGWGLRGDVSYSTFGFKSPLTGSASLLGGQVNVTYDIPMEGGFKPYVLAGISFYNASAGCTGCTSESKVGFGGGVGANFAAGGQTLFVEARYQTVQTSGSSSNWIPISIGIKF